MESSGAGKKVISCKICAVFISQWRVYNRVLSLVAQMSDEYFISM